MVGKIQFELVSPEKVVYKGEVESLSLPSKQGRITILPGHGQLVSSLGHGSLHVHAGGKEEIYSLIGGFVQVNEGSKVLIMADASEHISEIDEKKAQEAKTRAESLLQEVRDDKERFAEVNAELLQAVTRLSLVHKHRTKHSIKID